MKLVGRRPVSASRLATRPSVSQPPESNGHRLWIGAHEPICAGLIAGAALVGIADILTKVFLL